MATSDKLREIAEKYGDGFYVEDTEGFAAVDNTDALLSDLTALISEHYVAKEEVDKMVSERLRGELMKFLIWENRTHNIPNHIMERILDSYFKYLKSREK